MPNAINASLPSVCSACGAAITAPHDKPRDVPEPNDTAALLAEADSLPSMFLGHRESVTNPVAERNIQAIVDAARIAQRWSMHVEKHENGDYQIEPRPAIAGPWVKYEDVAAALRATQAALALAEWKLMLRVSASPYEWAEAVYDSQALLKDLPPRPQEPYV